MTAVTSPATAPTGEVYLSLAVVVSDVLGMNEADVVGAMADAADSSLPSDQRQTPTNLPSDDRVACQQALDRSENVGFVRRNDPDLRPVIYAIKCPLQNSSVQDAST